MSISNNKRKRKKNASFPWSWSSGVFVIASMLLAGSGFALNSSTLTSMTTAFAQEGNNTTAASTPSSTTATTTTNTSSGIKLSSQPIYQESVPPGSVTPINQTHIAATHIGSGTLTLPNSNQTINTISNGTAIVSLVTPSAIAKETIRTPNGETATLTFYEIIQFSNPAEAPLGGGKGIKIIIFHTNSTGMLAPLDGVIATGINDLQPNGESELTAWRWESGIPLSTGATATATTPPSEDSPPLMETPTATDATADDTTATATAPPAPEQGGGEEEQQQQTTIAPNPLFE
jgi:hypothetical protein